MDSYHLFMKLKKILTSQDVANAATVGSFLIAAYIAISPFLKFVCSKVSHYFSPKASVEEFNINSTPYKHNRRRLIILWLLVSITLYLYTKYSKPEEPNKYTQEKQIIGAAYYGYIQGGEWKEKFFNILGKANNAYPSIGDEIIANTDVNIRSDVIKCPLPECKLQADWKNMPAVGVIKSGMTATIDKIIVPSSGSNNGTAYQYVWVWLRNLHAGDADKIRLNNPESTFITYKIDIFVCEEKEVSSLSIARKIEGIIINNGNTGKVKVRLLNFKLNDTYLGGLIDLVDSPDDNKIEIRFNGYKERLASVRLQSLLSSNQISAELMEVGTKTSNYISMFICSNNK